jgi:hypothetical protein
MGRLRQFSETHRDGARLPSQKSLERRAGLRPGSKLYWPCREANCQSPRIGSSGGAALETARMGAGGAVDSGAGGVFQLVSGGPCVRQCERDCGRSEDSRGHGAQRRTDSQPGLLVQSRNLRPLPAHHHAILPAELCSSWKWHSPGGLSLGKPCLARRECGAGICAGRADFRGRGAGFGVGGDLGIASAADRIGHQYRGSRGPVGGVRSACRPAVLREIRGGHRAGQGRLVGGAGSGPNYSAVFEREWGCVARHHAAL